MKITQLLQEDKVTLSLEVFPPKKDTAVEQVSRSVREIAALQPDFMSVTYGAGGGTSAYTVQIVKDIKAEYNVPSMAHLTCVSSTKETVKKQLECMQEAGIENVLALRGDIPADAEFPLPDQFHYAVELVRYIKQIAPEMCIGGACYPEGHPEAVSKAQDIQHIKEKVDAGCEFLTTQMFFDNNILYNFMYKALKHGIDVPVVAGIMPITNANQVKRSIALSGSLVPRRFLAIVDRFGSDPAAMKQAGIAYATDQIIDLIANGVNAIHVYSMNKPDVAAQIQANLSEIL